MLPYLFHIHGPFYANCYGLAIAVGIIVFTYLVNRDPKRAALLSSDQLNQVILIGTATGIIGGRALWAIGNWPQPWWELFKIWEGGFSVLGTILAILAYMPFYLARIGVPSLKFMDLISAYAPLAHAISRIGCFLAGCCYGLPTSMPWGVSYTHPDVQVPLELKFIPIHPAQLYSSLGLLFNFLILRYVLRPKLQTPGTLTGCYLVLSGTERFITDFWRADREYISTSIKLFQIISLHQWLSLSIIALGLGRIIQLLLFSRNKSI